MARPHKHAKSGVCYFRQRVPKDLHPILDNKIVSKSLGTKDPDRAKVLNVSAVQKRAMLWEQCRKAPEQLPHAKIQPLTP